MFAEAVAAADLLRSEMCGQPIQLDTIFVRDEADTAIRITWKCPQDRRHFPPCSSHCTYLQKIGKLKFDWTWDE
jgi:hypothetical protein